MTFEEWWNKTMPILNGFQNLNCDYIKPFFENAFLFGRANGLKDKIEKEEQMPITKVFEICNAYESGFGHGVQQDGLNGDYYPDPKLNEAYKLGYSFGEEQAYTHRKEE